MGNYYVMSPRFPEVNAVVEAPTTEKARTVFLDYLERSHGAPRQARGMLRRDMVAEKVEEPSMIDATAQLSYGYSAATAPTAFVGASGQGLSSQGFTYGGPDDYETEGIPIEDESLEGAGVTGGMPIQRVALGGMR